MHPRRQLLFAGLTLLVGCGSVAQEGPPAPTAPPPVPRSIPLAHHQLQIMTWNVLFMELNLYVAGVPVPGFEPEFEWRLAQSSFNGLSYEDRAVKVASGIKAAAPDVVVLNEVFSDEVRAILVDELKGEYPHYVSYLAGEPPIETDELAVLDFFADALPEPFASAYVVEPLDSGLMLFSTVPFAPLDHTYDDASLGLEAESFGSVGSDFVAFRRYDECSGIDCLASKGVGLVALDTSPARTFVAFTHMQAEDAPEARRSQFAEIEELLTEVIEPDDLGHSPVYVAGDMNVPGGEPEWSAIFDPQASEVELFACGNTRPCWPSDARLLTDAWGFESSPADPGPTSQGQRRLDYILHNNPDDFLCMQHVRKPYEVRVPGGGGWWSDHRPVLADMNRPGLWCSPNLNDTYTDRRPHVLSFGALDCSDDCNSDIHVSTDDGAYIDHAGGMQWFVVDQPGAYSFRTTTDHPYPDVEVAFDVYHESDLSRSLLPHDDEPHPEHGWTYAMHSPPYYIRTYVTQGGEPNRGLGNVEYDFFAHQHLCRSPWDACAIDPLDEVEHPWPLKSPTADVPEIWYRFKTASVHDGKLVDGGTDGAVEPDVSFLLDYSVGEEHCVAEPYIVDYSDPVSPGGIVALPGWVDLARDEDEDFDDDGEADWRWTAEPLPGDADDFRQYYLAIPRNCDDALRTTTRMETTLTYVEPGYTECDKQYEDSGFAEDDHVGFHFTFDEGHGPAPSCENACDAYGTFDEDWPEGAQTPGSADLSQHAALRGYYVEYFVPNFFEEEGDEHTADARLNLAFLDDPSNALDLHAGHGFGPLPATVHGIQGLATFADSTDNDDADYWYTMKFEMNHSGPRYESP